VSAKQAIDLLAEAIAVAASKGSLICEFNTDPGAELFVSAKADCPESAPCGSRHPPRSEL